MSNRNFAPSLNLPTRRQKGLVKLFSGNAGAGIPAPFYYTTDTLREGQPVKFGTSQDLVLNCPQDEATSCVGLSMQDTYDESSWDSQLQGYYFANNTKEKAGAKPIGILMGSGFAMTTNYKGTVAWGERAYIGASGYLANSGDADDKLPVVFEGAGTDGATPVRIRFDFSVVS